MHFVDAYFFFFFRYRSLPVLSCQVTIVNRSKDKMAELQAEFPDLEIDFKLMDEMWDVSNYHLAIKLLLALMIFILYSKGYQRKRCGLSVHCS